MVQANLRGGGEFGEDWHRAGMLDKKQNVFDDFVAVARQLMDSGVTRPSRISIWGGSNGGLLVAAALVQHPELFRAAVANVPLTDMLRFQHFLLGRLWTGEYGDPADPKAFPGLLAWSPYHGIREGVTYPALLVTTGSHDTRVAPLHARKLVAALQQANAGPHPILLRVEQDAGHGAGKPLSVYAEEATDELAFVYRELGME